VNDVTTTALHSALRGLSLRQRTIADNIANVETPGFLAGRVDFESSLRDAVAAGRPADAGASTARSVEPTRLNGNNVNLDAETLALVETGLRYQLTVQALTNKFTGVRSAIGRQA
jgi:flagellar basal-body rod protein FlgB